MQIRSLVRAAHGLATFARRRSAGYVGHLLGGVALPQAAYRFGWGPAAPPLLQGVFAAAGELAAAKTDPADLQRLALVAPPGPVAQAVEPRAAEVERLMNRAHAAGITGVHYSFRNLVRTPDGEVAFGDLSKARKHQPGSIYFVASRDTDRQIFNQVFGTSLPTEAAGSAARAGLGHSGRRNGSASGPGPGLARPSVFTAGNCDEFTRQVMAPLIAGKRVLDLGSNDGALPLSMLRAGAREVVAVEFAPAGGEGGGMSARVISWRDVKPYDTQVLQGDMRLFLTADLGSFDVVTALSALHYLPADEMAHVISRAAAMGTVLILQPHDAIESLPARTVDLHRLMRDNGYDVQIHTATGCDRPLLVGSPSLPPPADIVIRGMRQAPNL
jgi:hypothetical protein